MRDMAVELGLPPGNIPANVLTARERNRFDVSPVHLWVLVRLLLVVGDILPVDKWWIGGSFAALTVLVIRARAVAFRRSALFRRLNEEMLEDEDVEEGIEGAGVSIIPLQTCPACRQPLRITVYVNEDIDMANSKEDNSDSNLIPRSHFVTHLQSSYKNAMQYLRLYVYWPDVLKRVGILGWCLTLAWASHYLNVRLRKLAMRRVGTEQQPPIVD